MDNDLVENFKDDFALLIEGGFIAVKQLDEVSAARIFHAAQLISPESTAPQVGLGYIALNKLDLKEAAKIFQEVIAKEPDNHLAQVFYGISFLFSEDKRKKGEKLIREAMEKATDPTVKNLGVAALSWAEKDLKKGALPVSAR